MTAVRTELYRHFDVTGRLLYVGVSLSSVSRLLGHREGSAWFDQIVTITIEHFTTRANALAAEAIAIANEKPLFNVRKNDLSRTVEKSILSFGQAARLLGVDRAMMKADQHPVVRGIPHPSGDPRYNVRFKRSDIDAYLAPVGDQ